MQKKWLVKWQVIVKFKYSVVLHVKCWLQFIFMFICASISSFAHSTDCIVSTYVMAELSSDYG